MENNETSTTEEVMKRRKATFEAWLKFIVFFQLCISIPAHLLSEKTLENIFIILSQWEFTFILYMIGNIFFYIIMIRFLRRVSDETKCPTPSTCLTFLGWVSLVTIFFTLGRYKELNSNVLQMITDNHNEALLIICKDYILNFLFILHLFGIFILASLDSYIVPEKLDNHDINNKKQTPT